jgi:hypothetical protein
MEEELGTQIYCCSGQQLIGERRAMDQYNTETLSEAIDELIAQVAQLESDLITEEARKVIAETVGHLLRDVGKVDPPFPRI